MTLLDSNLTTQLAGLLEKMVNPINLVAYVDSSENSQKVIELLQEVANQSNKITVIKDDKSSTKRIPSFSITNPQNNISVSFAGLPLGHEFSSLVLAILQVSGYAPKISDEQRKAILRLGSHDVTTYMSVTCINCPEVVQSLNTISIINPKVKHITVEGSAFKDEVDALGVMSVPAVFENGKMISSGRSSIDELVAMLLRQEENGDSSDSSDSSDSTEASDSSLAQKMNAKNPYDVLIVGGGPAASAAAIYTARKGLKTAMIMDHRGGQVVETESIENHISQTHTTGAKLANDLTNHIAQYNIDVFTPDWATSLDVAEEPYGLHTINTKSGGSLKAKAVIIATGATWRTLGVPGEDEYRNRGVSFCPHCDGPLFKNKNVVVVGGGNSGVEAAIDLAGIANHVTVIEFMDSLKADQILLNTLHSLSNTNVITSASLSKIEGDNKKVSAVHYMDRNENNAENREKILHTDGVFVQIGLMPNTKWVANKLSLNNRAEIVTDRKGCTSIPGIFAAGDCSDEPYKQIVTAYGSGANAALSAFDYLIRDPHN
ncbi:MULTISPECIES: alkyl hydroperoxide reductase subunit F [Gardnerella]|uniref:Alkyl hydroperoxide reductase, F subunit n=2 Tax=Gardnerella pickettii TaxID=2914924 RepID=T2PLB4_9BIFI|nr:MULTISPECIES: alkyl hydroperoxide reductase subunit F [Gardnerella]EPI49983.1 alkyl hydroperoxide reductase, F subunit [Gardnerella pickettii JCP7719]EPI52659.1 alkyl hydroperoxide reductase, F subunit [Gardnerella pickettii JCP8017A]EPI55929.1 alkyl hydroperoxide reductase, F subunit [Gardnerella pickettii JCP7659]EPI61937.1 alkyl hydroperoxide reductase, F subunit [Gardnerella pickettii JCP8017B]NSX26355.1 alkyl hydroperoxide reductase subunit F [Gardnerella vaginalis]